MSPVNLSIRDALDDGLPNPRGETLANISIIFGCLSIVFVTARILTRIYVHKIVGIDDYLIVVATLLAVGMTFSYNEEAHNGFGLHQDQVSYSHRTTAFKYFFVAQLLYKFAAAFTKVSLLFLYLRIFTNRKFRIAAWATMGVVIAYSSASICATIWQCNPIAKAWNKKLDGSCISIGSVWYSTSVMAIVTDLAIIVLPIDQIRSLKLPRGQKLGLTIMFSLGIFVIATTVVRMILVGPAITKKDTTYYQAESNSWTFLEVNVGIICASLPTLRQPVTRFFPRVFGTTFSSQGATRDSNSKRKSYAFSPGSANRNSDWIRVEAGDPPKSETAFGAGVADLKTSRENDEVFILQGLDERGRGIKKTTNIGITFEERELSRAGRSSYFSSVS